MAEKRAIKFEWTLNGYAVASMPKAQAEATRNALNLVVKVSRALAQIAKILANHAETLKALEAAKSIEGWHAASGTKCMVDPAKLANMLTNLTNIAQTAEIVKLQVQQSSERVMTLEEILGINAAPPAQTAQTVQTAQTAQTAPPAQTAKKKG